MNPTLLLRLDPLRAESARWALLDGQADVEDSGTGVLEDLRARASGRDVVILVPTEDVLLTRVSIPTQNRQKFLQALPFALEDQLAGDIDDLHFVPGQRQGDGACPVAVVRHTRMRDWLDALAGAGLEPKHLIPDALAVPKAHDAWSCIIDGSRFVVRTGEGTGFAGETENLEILLQAALDEYRDDAPSRLIVGGTGLETPPETDLAVEHLGDSANELFARGVSGGAALDLRTAPYTGTDDRRARWRPWIPAAALLLALIVIDTSRIYLDRWQLQQELATQDERVETIFREVFPDANRVVAPRERMEGRLRQLRAGERPVEGDLLDTLLIVGPHLRADDDFRISGMSWRGDTLDIQLTARSLQELDRLKQTLDDDSQLSAEIRQASSEEDEVQGRLTIRREAS